MTEPVVLSTDTCWRLVAGKVIGRVGFNVGRGPRIHPMNYAVDGETVLLRTSRASEFALFTELFAAGAPVAFEVDHIVEEQRRGWSVLMGGSLAPIDDSDEQRRLNATFRSRPWADGDRDYLVRLTPVEVTGRQLGT